jgi:hypothetical protein
MNGFFEPIKLNSEHKNIQMKALWHQIEYLKKKGEIN